MAISASNSSFPFVAAAQITCLLAEFERNCLARFTPCRDLAEFELADAIATTHVEFILIHPFREGNGRISRLLADVMAVQAGRGTLGLHRVGREQAVLLRRNPDRDDRGLRVDA